MVLPALAAGAARVAAVSGRAAAGASKAAAGAGRTAASASGRAAGTAARTGGSATRSLSQMKSQFIQARADAQRFRSVNDMAQRERIRQSDANENEEEGLEQPMSPMQKLQAAQAQMQNISGSQTSKFKKGIAMARAFNAMEAANPEQAKPTQDLAKAAVKKVIPKLAMFIANAIAGALELGTGGIALFVTFFVRLITLGWYNTEMVYGGWIKKGRHMIVGPLTWDPIPMPGEKKGRNDNAVGPTILVIMSDLFVILMAVASLAILLAPVMFIVLSVNAITSVFD